jgi:hypothetical protein
MISDRLATVVLMPPWTRPVASNRAKSYEKFAAMDETSDLLKLLLAYGRTYA